MQIFNSKNPYYQLACTRIHSPYLSHSGRTGFWFPNWGGMGRLDRGNWDLFTNLRKDISSLTSPVGLSLWTPFAGVGAVERERRYNPISDKKEGERKRRHVPTNELKWIEQGASWRAMPLGICRSIMVAARLMALQWFEEPMILDLALALQRQSNSGAKGKYRAEIRNAYVVSCRKSIHSDHAALVPETNATRVQRVHSFEESYSIKHNCIRFWSADWCLRSFFLLFKM